MLRNITAQPLKTSQGDLPLWAEKVHLEQVLDEARQTMEGTLPWRPESSHSNDRTHVCVFFIKRERGGHV